MPSRLTLARLGRGPRWFAALACLLLAAGTALAQPAAPGPPAARGVPVVVAARPLAAGHHLTARDLRVARWPRGQLPDGVAARAGPLVGRVVAGPIAAREAVLPLRLVDTALTAGLPAGQVALPVDLAADVTGLIRAGGRVDLLAVPAGDTDPAGTGGRSRADAVTAAAGVRVLAVLPPSGDASGGAGSCLVVAVTSAAAARLAGMGGSWRFTAVARQP